MRASQLVTQLQGLIALYGDAEIVLEHPETEYPLFGEPIQVQYVREDTPVGIGWEVPDPLYVLRRVEPKWFGGGV